jgi:hypothetical protein
VRLLVGAQGEDAALRLGGLHLFPPHRDFSDICVHLHNHVAAQLAGRRAASQQGGETLTISVPVTGLLHSTLSQRSQLHADVARSVRFSDPLQLLADSAAARLLERTGARAFNSAHLRIEDDFHVTASGARAPGDARGTMHNNWAGSPGCHTGVL